MKNFKKLTQSNKVWIAFMVFAMAIVFTGFTSEAALSKPKGMTLDAWDTSSPSTKTNNHSLITWKKDSAFTIYETKTGYALVYQDTYYAGYEVEIQWLTSKSKWGKTKKYDMYSSKLGTTEKFGFVDGKGDVIGLQFNAKTARNKGFRWRVRSYYMDDLNQKTYSGLSNWSVVVGRPDVKFVEKGKGTSSKISQKIKWTKVKNAKSYTIYLSKNGGKYTKLKTVSAKINTYTLTGLKTYTDYKIYVQADKVKIGNKRYTSIRDKQGLSGVNGWYYY